MPDVCRFLHKSLSGRFARPGTIKGERGITDNSVYIVGALPDAFPIPTQVLSSILAAWDECAKYNFRAHSGFRRLLREFAES